MTLIILLLSGLLHASSDDMDMFEKTFPKDNTFCYQNGKRIEILIRGSTKYTEPNERGYGEFFFTRLDGQEPKLLPLNSTRSDSLKFFPGDSKVCTKTMGFSIDKETAGILLLKDDRPYKEKLVIQFFDLTTLTPKDHLETIYSTDKVKITKDGFVFNNLDEKIETVTGKIKIEGVEYTYQDREFPKWMSYTSKGFEVLSTMTYENFPTKMFFKDEADFLLTTGWNPTKREFMNNVLYVAVNHKLKKACLLVELQKKKLDGSEKWRCQGI